MPTARIGLPTLLSSQSQKFVTVNEALQILDLAANLVVIRADFTDPPVSPSELDAYIPASPAGGAWVGQENKVAMFTNGDWVFSSPVEGWRAYNQATNDLLIFNGTTWISFSSGALGSQVPEWGVNTAADATNRLSVKSDAVLFSHDDVTPGSGDMRITVNRATSTEDAAWILQTGFTTDALIGMLGTANFEIKLGAGSTTALVGDVTSGAVGLPQHPKFSAYMDFGQTVTFGAWTLVTFNNTRHNDQSAYASSVFTAPHDGYYSFGAGLVFEDPGSSVPTEMSIGLSVNGATPTPDATAVAEGLVTTSTSLRVTGLLKLSASDTVDVRVRFETNDGRVLADENHFWGYQVP